MTLADAPAFRALARRCWPKAAGISLAASFLSTN